MNPQIEVEFKRCYRFRSPWETNIRVRGNWMSSPFTRIRWGASQSLRPTGTTAGGGRRNKALRFYGPVRDSTDWVANQTETLPRMLKNTGANHPQVVDTLLPKGVRQGQQSSQNNHPRRPLELVSQFFHPRIPLRQELRPPLFYSTRCVR